MISHKKQHFILVQDDLMFVPYLQHMIPTYHEWMSDPNMLYLTGSDALTLQEEMDNQEDWLQDPRKYTFIILHRRDALDMPLLQSFDLQNVGPHLLSIGVMVGDVNLFLHDYLEANEAEIDVMVANKDFQRRGIAQRAINVMMQFGRTHYQRERFVAKIKRDNQASIGLFTTKMAFMAIKEVECFNEIHYARTITIDKLVEYQEYSIA